MNIRHMDGWIICPRCGMELVADISRHGPVVPAHVCSRDDLKAPRPDALDSICDHCSQYPCTCPKKQRGLCGNWYNARFKHRCPSILFCDPPAGKHKIQWSVNTLETDRKTESPPQPKAKDEKPRSEADQRMLDELDAISAEVDKAWLNLFEEGVEKLSEAGREVLEQMHEMVEKAGELDKIIALASTLATRDEIKTLVGRSFRKDNKVRIVKAVTKIRASHKGRPTGTIQWKRPDDKRGLTSSVKDFRHWLIGAVEVEDA